MLENASVALRIPASDIEGNYPSKPGSGERANWFYDSEGNLFGLGQMVP